MISAPATPRSTLRETIASWFRPKPCSAEQLFANLIEAREAYAHAKASYDGAKVRHDDRELGYWGCVLTKRTEALLRAEMAAKAVRQ